MAASYDYISAWTTTNPTAFTPEHRQTSAWAQSLSLSPAQACGDQPQSSLGEPDLHSDGAGIGLSLRGHRPGQSEGSVVAAVDHDGSRFVHRSGRGSACPLWQHFSAMLASSR